MATRERLIVEAILDALRDAQIEGIERRVTEERGFSVNAVDLPSIDVAIEDASFELQDLADVQLRHTLRVSVAVLAVEKIGVSPSKRADPILAAAWRALMTDTALAALHQGMTPTGARVERQSSGDGVVLRRSLVLEIEHRTRFDDLESAP